MCVRPCLWLCLACCRVRSNGSGADRKQQGQFFLFFVRVRRWQVEVEEDECSHGNLMSMGRMLSLPSDSCIQPFRCSPYPPVGYDIYAGYSFSGNHSDPEWRGLIS